MIIGCIIIKDLLNDNKKKEKFLTGNQPVKRKKVVLLHTIFSGYDGNI